MTKKTYMEESIMADKAIAQRVKAAILSKYTYEQMEQLSGISISTLKRIMSAQRELTIPEIKLIAKLTNKDAIELAFGDDHQLTQDAEAQVENRTDKTKAAHRFVINNLQTLDDEDIMAIARQISALCTVAQAEKHRKIMEGIDSPLS